VLAPGPKIDRRDRALIDDHDSDSATRRDPDRPDRDRVALDDLPGSERDPDELTTRTVRDDERHRLAIGHHHAGEHRRTRRELHRHARWQYELRTARDREATTGERQHDVRIGEIGDDELTEVVDHRQHRRRRPHRRRGTTRRRKQRCTLGERQRQRLAELAPG